jgi:hypothetical protein
VLSSIVEQYITAKSGRFLRVDGVELGIVHMSFIELSTHHNHSSGYIQEHIKGRFSTLTDNVQGFLVDLKSKLIFALIEREREREREREN